MVRAHAWMYIDYTFSTYVSRFPVATAITPDPCLYVEWRRTKQQAEDCCGLFALAAAAAALGASICLLSPLVRRSRVLYHYRCSARLCSSLSVFLDGACIRLSRSLPPVLTRRCILRVHLRASAYVLGRPLSVSVIPEVFIGDRHSYLLCDGRNCNMHTNKYVVTDCTIHIIVLLFFGCTTPLKVRRVALSAFLLLLKRPLPGPSGPSLSSSSLSS